MECLVQHNAGLGFVAQGLSCVMDAPGGAASADAVAVRVGLGRSVVPRSLK